MKSQGKSYKDGRAISKGIIASKMKTPKISSKVNSFKKSIKKLK